MKKKVQYIIHVLYVLHICGNMTIALSEDTLQNTPSKIRAVYTP